MEKKGDKLPEDARETRHNRKGMTNGPAGKRLPYQKTVRQKGHKRASSLGDQSW